MIAVAVTGSNGFVGTHVLTELSSPDFSVRGLVRSRDRVQKAQRTAAQFVEVDYDDGGSIVRSLRGVDMVVHLLGQAHQDKTDPLTYARVNVEYTRRVMDASVQAGARRFVFVSSVKACGNGSLNPYSENTTPRPEDPYGRSKLAAEVEVCSVAKASSIEYAILRPPLIYGAGVKGNLRKLISAIERGLPIPVARSTTNVRSLISGRNLASAIRQTLAHDKPVGDMYFVSDGTDLSTKELIAVIARVADKTAHTMPLPPSFLRGIARLVRKGPAADRLLGSLRVDSSPFRQQFQWSPPYSAEDGFREAVNAFRSETRRVRS